MLSPIAEEIVFAQNKAERGKRRVEERESNNSDTFSLLIEMKSSRKS